MGILQRFSLGLECAKWRGEFPMPRGGMTERRLSKINYQEEDLSEREKREGRAGWLYRVPSRVHGPAYRKLRGPGDGETARERRRRKDEARRR